MPQNEFAEYSFTFFCVVPLSSLVGLSLFSSLVKKLSSEEEETKANIFSSHFLFLFLWTLLIILLLLIFKDFLIEIFSDQFGIIFYAKEKFLIFIVVIFTNIFLTNIYGVLISRSITREIMLFNFVRYLSLNIICLILIYTNFLSDDSSLSRYYGIVISESLILAIYLFHFSKIYLKKYFDYKVVIDSLKLGLPLMPQTIFALVIVFYDKSLILQNFGSKELASYNLAILFLSPIPLLMSSINIVFAPNIYKLKNISDTYSLLKKTWVNSFVIFFILSLIIYALVNPLIKFQLISPDYFLVPNIILSVFIGFIASSLVQLNNSTFLHFKKTYFSMIIGFFTVLCYFVSNYFLIPVYSVFGAAISYNISFISAFFIGFILIKVLVVRERG